MQCADLLEGSGYGLDWMIPWFVSTRCLFTLPGTLDLCGESIFQSTILQQTIIVYNAETSAAAEDVI